ncbi:hypothetical protein BGX38DRAFT_565911 [Terfezia claveryi]|nr:hypothetical protein BGX38DRAFT_565911 [Terfezia claveryi]
MDRNGDHMAVDPVSPAANYKEKEFFEDQPIRPRRNSIEDQDSSRPRKRLATMGSTTPQGSSPATDKEDMDRSPRSTTLSPSSTTTAMTPNPAPTLADQAMDQTPDAPLPLHDSTTEELPVKELPTSPVPTREATAPVCPPRPLPDAVETSEDGPTYPDAQEPIIISVEPEREPSLSPSVITSASGSPWQDGSHLRSPEVEVEELDGMEEDEVLTESITVVGDDPERSMFDHKEILNQIAREFALGPNPRIQLNNVEGYLARFLASSEEDQMKSLHSQSKTWYHIPELVRHLLKRREVFSQEFVQGRNQYGRRIMAKLLTRFLQLSIKFTELEQRTFQDTPSNSALTPFSDKFLAASAEILIAHDDLFIHLQKDYHIDLASDVAVTLPELLETWGGLQAIKGYIQGIYIHLSEKPKLLGFTIGPLNFIAEFLRSAFQRDWLHEVDQDKRQSFMTKLCEGVMEIVAMAESRTKKILESQGQSVNIKDYAQVVDILGNCVSYLNASIYNYGLRLLPQQSLENFHSLSPHERGEYSQALFKLPMFTTMIRCNRMDCRLSGISKLTDCLLNLWRSLGGESNPALRFMADDIRRSGIIEYLVGPESHPELIRLSYNIGSFLVVNHCLTPDILQAVWQPLIDNKDPRIVQGVIKMVVEFVSHMQYSYMVDLCRRAIDIPFSSYDTSMLDFVSHIISTTPRKYVDSPESPKCLDSAPYLLIIGLIRKASIAEDEGQTCKGVLPSIISDNMSHELINLTQYGPPPDMRKSIYLECVADIKNKNASATGSIIVLWALLQRRPRTTGGESPDVNILTRELGCVDALIDDIAAFVESHRNRDPGLRARKLKARLDLLHWILLRSPGRITSPQIEQVCEYLIGSKSLGYQERDMAFNNFALLVNPNPFLDHFFQHVYPTLNPLYLSLNCLEACKKWVEHTNKSPPQVSSTQVVLLKGMEQVWKVILTVPERHLYLEAINFLIKMYLESYPVTKNGPDIIYATHCSLVETCIQQLTSCAVESKVLNDTNVFEQSMVVDMPEKELGERRRKFERAIAVLNELLKGYRAKPRYPPGANIANCHGENRKILGTPIVITIRGYNQGLAMPVQNIHMGSLDSAEDLHKQITRVVGSSDYRTISSGQELYLRGEPQKTLGEIGFSGPVTLMVQKRPTENGQAAEPAFKGVPNSVEAKILEHFDELYEMLDSREHQGQLIHDLLRQFPPQPRAQDILVSESVPPEDILPLAAPYRSLYLLNAMRVWVDDTVQTEETIKYANRMVNSLICFLMKQDLAGNSLIELRFHVLNDAIGILNKFLTIPLKNSESFGSCFGDETKFTSQIINIWEYCLQPQYSRFEVSPALAVGAFLLILEAARLRKGIWTAFTTSKKCTQATERMLLHDSRESVRQSIVNFMARTCNNTNSHSSFGDVPCIEVARFFWSMLVDMLPQAFSYEEQATQLFDIAKYFLDYLGRNSEIDVTVLNKYFLDWTDVLMTHKVKQIIGRPSEDYIVIGYTTLLLVCRKILRGRLECSDLPSRIIEIFCNLLFTPLTRPGTEGDIPEETLPCMGSMTREKLYQLFLQLSEDESVNNTIVRLLSELVSQDQTAILPETLWNFDRTQLTISNAGRVGLRNLSNTCYLNSLITQLFMNVPFRSFILNMSVDDPEDSQNLLHAIKSLFAKMQNGLVKTADTRELAQAIKDYENNEIDVTVQMDVDEFFNLLFDRIEGQLESVEQKNMFRSFYGGKLVQQVKSKECPHISEREEPFSAIQCDIKGKTGLQESLKAYVEGEIMEGDNKYSCTSCNKHVDAVKRACLKEIPDHLIFHLKRFEFDLNTMVRSKINDSFEFPECIDMRPYTIQYLSDSDPCTTPDVFQLAGVLVHNGTAESGHYYSYIKDRHEFNEHSNSIWFEFNDSEVSSFDPSVIPHQCYGGTDFIGPSKELGQPIAFQKSYSAYMLFYERVKPLRTDEQKLSSLRKIPIARDLAIDILQDNERSALQLALKTFEQIASRIKDSREADDLFITIRELIQSRNSIACAKGFLRWICDNPEPYRLILLRCPHQRIRESFANLVLTALIHIRRKDHVTTEDEDIPPFSEYHRIFDDVLRATLDLWDCLNHFFKPWDEYFLILMGITNFGKKEKEILLRLPILKRCFWLFMPEYLDREVRGIHPNVVKLFEKNPKRISCRMLLEFMEHLLEPIHIGLNSCKNEDYRILASEYEAYPLTHEEKELLFLTVEKDRTVVNVFFFKQVSYNINGPSTQRLIRKFLTLDQEPTTLLGLTDPLKAALLNGIVIDPANEAAPYLEALVEYCSYIKHPTHVKEIISRVSEEVGTIGMNGGAEHFTFFYHLLLSRNQKLKPPTFATNRVIEAVPQWAPPLLCFPETEVRENTEHLLKEKLFQPRFEGNTSEGRRRIIENAVEKLPEACFRFAEDKFLKNKDLCVAADEKTFDSLFRILELCPRNDVEEDPGYSSRIDGTPHGVRRYV